MRRKERSEKVWLRSENGKSKMEMERKEKN